MKWQDRGYYGQEVRSADKCLGCIAQKVYGDKERRWELASLNNITKDTPRRVGDCLEAFYVEW
ncbi:MAG: hypothetical protein OXC82_04700 [Rhodobacteraceae bacterium]|nr:hypothetical protein [Paracoccaceae bacterium]MCY4249720.1 hypothetical protein [Paracoccaceae bacterium]